MTSLTSAHHKMFLFTSTGKVIAWYVTNYIIPQKALLPFVMVTHKANMVI